MTQEPRSTGDSFAPNPGHRDQLCCFPKAEHSDDSGGRGRATFLNIPGAPPKLTFGTRARVDWSGRLHRNILTPLKGSAVDALVRLSNCAAREPCRGNHCR